MSSRIFVSILRNATFSTLAMVASYSANAETWTVDSATSKAGFVAIGSPGFLRISGEGARVKGVAQSNESDPAKVTVKGTFEVELASLKTGMSLRDKHMKEKYLEVGKFPVAALTIEAVDLRAIDILPTEQDFTGKLTLKGVTKQIHGRAKLTRTDPAVQVEANFSINLTDYPIDIPAWLGITVAEKVDVNVHFIANSASTH